MIFHTLGRPKIGLWCNARHTNGGQFSGPSWFAIEFARTRSNIISTAMESTDRLCAECRFGQQRHEHTQQSSISTSFQSGMRLRAKHSMTSQHSTSALIQFFRRCTATIRMECQRCIKAVTCIIRTMVRHLMPSDTIPTAPIHMWHTLKAMIVCKPVHNHNNNKNHSAILNVITQHHLDMFLFHAGSKNRK